MLLFILPPVLSLYRFSSSALSRLLDSHWVRPYSIRRRWIERMNLGQNTPIGSA